MNPRSFLAVFACVSAFACVCALAATSSGRRDDHVVLLGNVSGSQAVTVRSADSASADFFFNDRGRGDRITTSWKLDAAGVLIEYSGRGNDYMKVPVTEAFRLKNGRATWRSLAERGEKTLNAPAFYVPANGPPEIYGVLARALLKASGRHLALLPAGEASIEAAGALEIETAAGKAELFHYRITGLGLTPQSIWLEKDGSTAAVASTWLSTLGAAYEQALPKLLDAQAAADNAWSARFAQDQTHTPKGDLVIRNARLFDPRDLSVASGTGILIRGEHIVRVCPDAELTPASDAEVIDAGGRFVMPGLWDNHQHFSDVDGALDIANGVTSARDMANDLESFPARVARFDAGTEIGPRVFKAGIIDGTGEFAGPTTMRVDTAAQAIQDVNWYADHGYGQIKMYSSLKPELIPVIAEAAHARGLRVSGHVPAFTNAQAFIAGGADEIQHINFIVLNFLFDTVKDTRNMNRFIAVAEHAREIQVENPKVREFIAYMKAHRTALDPTMNVFEGLFSGDPAAVPPGLEDVVPRFPPQIRRALRSGALAVPKGKQQMYREAFPALQRLLKSLHEAGITIIPGTDALSGYTLLHELELYAAAGIPPAEVLRLATLTSAQVSGVDSQRGVIAQGKQADLIVIDGDPLTDFSAIRRVSTVIKGGKVFDPAKIEAGLGIAPRH